MPEPREDQRALLTAEDSQPTRNLDQMVAERCPSLRMFHARRARRLQGIVQRVEARAEDVIVHRLDEITRGDGRLVQHLRSPTREIPFVRLERPRRGYAPKVPTRAREGAARDAEHAGAREGDRRRLHRPARHRGAPRGGPTVVTEWKT